MGVYDHLIGALYALLEEEGKISRRWFRDGVMNATRLVESNESSVDNVSNAILDSPTSDELDSILSFLIDITLEIQFNIDDIDRTEHLLRVGSEARATVRYHFGAHSAAEHALWANRPAFIWPTQTAESIEDCHICTKRSIVDDLSARVQEDTEDVLNSTMENQNPRRLMKFENPPSNISYNDRIENFLHSAQVLTLIGNVVDYRHNHTVEVAIDYYESFQNHNLEELIS